MSSGKVHAHASLFLAAGYLAGTVASQDITNAEYIIGALIGTILTPDLDVDNGYNGDKALRKLGRLPYFAWAATWHMYRKSLKHGSSLSHFPVIGTLVRLAYLFFFAVALPTWALSYVFPQIHLQSEMSWWLWHILPRWKIIVGLMSSDFHHYMMDIATVNDKFSIMSLVRRKTNYHRKTGS